MRVWGLLLLTALAVGGCTNYGVGRGTATDGTSAVNLQDPGSDGGSSYLVNLSQVLRSNVDPSGSFDLIGDGSGALGRFCVSTSGDSSTGPSTCQCRYRYTLSSGAEQAMDADTYYRETDLIRCKSAGIPTDITELKVKVYLSNSDAESNELTLRPSGSGFSSDQAAAKPVFREVKRYQCRDAIFVPLVTSHANYEVYDPFLSDDPQYSYPLNFYSSNLGAAMAYFANGPRGDDDGISGWLCPQNPDLDPSKVTSDLEKIFSIRAMPSESEAETSNVIYPPPKTADSDDSFFDRHTFSVAEKSSGAFTVPVHAWVAPNAVSTQNDVPAIGYAAKVIPNPMGSGEVCPDLTYRGYHWVKVWQFRASLADRQYKYSKTIASTALYCNPGPLPSGGPVVSSCGADGAYPAGRWVGDTKGTVLSDRLVRGTGSYLACARLQDSCAGTGAGANSSCVTNGTTHPYSDVWSIMKGAVAATGKGDLVEPVSTAVTSAKQVPFDPDTPVLGSIDGGVSRFDFLYVVTPPTVMISDMENTSSATAQMYTPVRKYQQGDAQIVYGLKRYDVVTGGEAPSSNSGSSSMIYPVCALQKD